VKADRSVGSGFMHFSVNKSQTPGRKVAGEKKEGRMGGKEGGGAVLGSGGGGGEGGRGGGSGGGESGRAVDRGGRGMAWVQCGFEKADTRLANKQSVGKRDKKEPQGDARSRGGGGGGVCFKKRSYLLASWGGGGGP